MLGLYSVMILAGYHRTLSLFPLGRFQNVARSCYGGTDFVSRSYSFRTIRVFDAPLLPANKRLMTTSTTVIDVPCHEERWLRDVQLAGIDSTEADWHKLGGVAESSGGRVAVVVEMLVLDDHELLFGHNARCTELVCAVKRELQWEWGIFRGELSMLQIMATADSLRLMEFELVIIASNRLVMHKIGKLQGTLTDKQATWKVVENKFTNVKEAVAESKELTANFTETDMF